MDLSKIFKGPSLLLRPDIARRNIRRMVHKARENKLPLRPHFKTHQSHEIGRWFREEGVDRITVSSIQMAEYFAADGWYDITIAFPINVLEHQRVNRLARNIQLQVILDHPQAARDLSEHLNHTVNVLIEVDCGDGRSGIPSAQVSNILALSELIRKLPHLHFAGLLTHAGQSYSELKTQPVEPWYESLIKPFHELRRVFAEAAPYENLFISYGDTPSCCKLNQFAGVDELRPGNFVFFDLTQVGIGSCTLQDIAVAMVAPVVSVGSGQVIVHGGGVHFSKDRMELNPEYFDHPQHYGWVVKTTETGWESLPTHYIYSLSQEHGVVHWPDGPVPLPHIGEMLTLLPVHSCMTADLMRDYFVLENEGKVRKIASMRS